MAMRPARASWESKSVLEGLVGRDAGLGDDEVGVVRLDARRPRGDDRSM